MLFNENIKGFILTRNLLYQTLVSKPLQTDNVNIGYLFIYYFIGPNRFSRFGVYWIQTHKQIPIQTDKLNLYIEDKKT